VYDLLKGLTLNSVSLFQLLYNMTFPQTPDSTSSHLLLHTHTHTHKRVFLNSGHVQPTGKRGRSLLNSGGSDSKSNTGKWNICGNSLSLNYFNKHTQIIDNYSQSFRRHTLPNMITLMRMTVFFSVNFVFMLIFVCAVLYILLVFLF